jgi:hypothetical protein
MLLSGCHSCIEDENGRYTRLGLPDAPGMATSGGSEHPGAREYPQRYAERDSRRRDLEVHVSAVAGGSDLPAQHAPEGDMILWTASQWIKVKVSFGGRLRIGLALLAREKRNANGDFRDAPWKKMLSNRSVWGMLLGYLCQGYPIYSYNTRFFIYLIRVRHLSISQGGVWGATSFFAIATLAPLGGWFSDMAVRNSVSAVVADLPYARVC